jgi:hypothetical protein
VNTTGTTFDVSPFASVNIEVEFPEAGQCLFIEFRTASGLTIRRNVIQSGFRVADVQGSMWRATMPVKGERLFLASDQGTPAVHLIGSLRPVDKITQDVMDANQILPAAGNASYLWQERANVINAANVHQVDLFPWIGTITADLQLTSTAVMGTSTAYWVRNQQGGGSTVIRRDTITADALTNSYGVTSSIALNGDALRWEISNTTAVNFTNVNITISPTGGAGL